MATIDATLNIRLGQLIDQQVELLARFDGGIEQIEQLKDVTISELTALKNTLKAELENAALMRFDYEEESNPLRTTNAGLHQKWFNLLTAELFVCIDATEDANVWIGSKDSIVGTLPMVPMGEAGAGVGIAPSELVQEFGLTLLNGTMDRFSENYGNYMHLASGSIMCFIPKHYTKLSFETAAPYLGLRVQVSETAQDGYALPRCFINNGVEVAGVFVDKYTGGKEGAVFVSKRYLDPVSTASAHNPISALTANGQTPSNTYDGMYAAVKSRGEHFSLATIFVYTMLANLADAHYQACWEKNDFAHCAWADVAPYQPKGCNNDALRDVNDASVVYQGSGYLNCGKTAGVNDAVLAKITHNGQKCGITDLNGNMWEVSAGYITSTSGAHLALKESIDVKNLTATTAYDTTNYDAVTIGLTLNSTQVSFGNGTNQFFSGETTRSANAYRLDSIGLPLSDTSVSVSGSERFGGDGFWRYQVNSMAPLSCGSWNHAELSGPRTRHLLSVRSSSSYSVGGRACLVPSYAG